MAQSQKCNPERIAEVDSFESLLGYLREDLDWDIKSVDRDEISFDWQTEDLRICEAAGARVKDGVVHQLRPVVTGQPWGIFLVEFTDGHVYRTALREVLRGLVPRRRRDPHLPAWQHEDLLFLCTTAEYDRFTFVHFRGEKMQKAKLAAFGWERGSPYVRTLCEFNLPQLRWPDDPADADAWRAQWRSAFDKEPLTKEFFKRFDNALDRIKDDLQEFQKSSSAEAYTSAQFLLERLLFLYFLQNRGWLNQERGYLFERFQKYKEDPEAFSYYQDFLEQLFWTLATAPSDRWRLPGIPFLNGGLFDDDEFRPDPNRKKHKPPLCVRNATFAYVFAELLEAFNFTVREDTPLNQDVAVDPEMLGKVFESIVLHAEAADPDAVAPDKRKATGSYYTPRIVVHFICREALRQYLLTHAASLSDHEEKVNALFDVDASDGLDTDEIDALKASPLTPPDGRLIGEILKDIKACDPAVGSGAFPVGLLHELVNLRRIAGTVANGFVDPVRQKGHQWIHDTKADIVESGLYGVDIQQQAIEICRLRLWLSLIVDYDLGLDPFEADVQTFRLAINRISQLPNLEMNFRRGDSLLDMISGVPVRVAPEQSATYRKEYEQIHKIGRKLHNAKRSQTKRKYRVEILRERLKLSERVLSEEIAQLERDDSVLANDWFGGSKSDVEKRRKIAHEVEQLNEALSKIKADQAALERLAATPMAADFNPRLRKLEGADFDSPFNFAWRLDYADILGPRRGTTSVSSVGDKPDATERVPPGECGGFDLILGNPPFVTTRNRWKREHYFDRWRNVCVKNFQMVCPFFALGFGLLRRRGHLGFIVSNAFAKREFGKPLIEDLFPTLDIQKLVDCSGLQFPGHGTPTCLVFGRNAQPKDNTPVVIAATLPGGGDLRTPPEKSPLWHALATHHDETGYTDERIAVGARPRVEVSRWPLDFQLESTPSLGTESQRLSDFIGESIGHQCITRTDDVFILAPDVARRDGVEMENLRALGTGETIRNWAPLEYHLIVYPYRGTAATPIIQKTAPNTIRYLRPFRVTLENVVMHGSVRKKETKTEWFEYSRIARAKLRTPLSAVIPEIATHVHALLDTGGVLFHQTAQMVKLKDSATIDDYHLVAGLLNSSSSLFWLKRLCFNKGAGADEKRDRFVYAGGKVKQLAIPQDIEQHLQGKQNVAAGRLLRLSRQTWGTGHAMPALALKKVYEMSGEAYCDWSASLPGHVPPAESLGSPFQSEQTLRESIMAATSLREEARAEMIALQEEMDWLVYAMYGLIEANHPAVGVDAPESVPALLREQRPFVLWQQAEGDIDAACELIPADWPDDRKGLWRARLECIRDNEHIQRIEQPVYKRRWDEQWKVKTRWECGQVAYDAEFVEAFDWWLSEKAEWWLEHEAAGGPVGIAEWAAALGNDTRVKAAWPVVQEAIQRLGKKDSFDRHFRNLAKSQSVPDDIPWAVPWDELEKKRKIPDAVKRIRGKLNVPRERFRTTGDGDYVWAGCAVDAS